MFTEVVLDDRRIISMMKSNGCLCPNINGPMLISSYLFVIDNLLANEFAHYPVKSAPHSLHPNSKHQRGHNKKDRLVANQRLCASFIFKSI